MRRGVTLVELIFTIVIIAMVFTVIPKIIFALNKSDKFAIRQDALFNGVSMFHMISNMPWDSNNTEEDYILGTQSVNFDCNYTTNRRMGGFVGSRECNQDYNATAINSTHHDGSSIWTLDNLNEFNNTLIEVNANGRNLYDLNITVSYIDDGGSVIHYTNQTALIDLNASNDESNSTNLKRLTVRVDYNGSRGGRRELARFHYTSANIGLMTINKRIWH